MKTKSFLLFSTSVFATSFFLILFHTQQPHSIQNIVTQTQQHIKDIQENLHDVEESDHEAEARYFRLLGMSGELERWRNTTVPAVVTYARADSHLAAVGFVRAAASLPFTVLVYNLGLKKQSLNVLASHCNSTKCVIVDFDLSEFPSHVSDESIYAFRPLIVQHAMSLVGGVVFAESGWRWTLGGAALGARWRALREEGRAGGAGLRAWPRRFAVTSLTHPRMFAQLGARPDDFLFLQMLDASRLLLAPAPLLARVLTPWVRCALSLDCIMPIGAQSGGCRFDKKPQYRYSGCHGRDASALSILLGLRWGFDEARYTARGLPWRHVADVVATPADANATAA